MSLRQISTTILTFLLSFSTLSAVQADGIGNSTLWVGQFYNNTSFSGSPALNRIDSTLEFDWGQGSPASFVNTNNFSAKWTANVNLSAGQYRFWALADDQVRIQIGGQDVINTFDTTIVDELVTGDITLNTGSYTIQVTYREYIGPAFLFVDYANLSLGESGPAFDNQSNTQTDPVGQWVASYYPNTSLSNNPVAIMNTPQAGGDWGTGAPNAQLPVDQWSARWTGNFLFAQDTYLFRTRADDGVRVYLDGALIIDEWHTARATVYSTTRSLSAGFHTVTVEYFESGGTASLDFAYGLATDTTTSSQPVQSPAPSILGTVTIDTGRLNVRDAPNPFTGDIITRVSEGETYQVLAFNTTETWAQINANGVTGWINAGYVDYNPVSSTSNNYQVVAEPYTVNIRSGPGTRFDDIGNFQDGDTATVIGRNADSTWWQINYNGIVGWVAARYAKIQSWADESQIPVTG